LYPSTPASVGASTVTVAPAGGYLILVGFPESVESVYDSVFTFRVTEAGGDAGGVLVSS
jgi:hypothetical protein